MKFADDYLKELLGVDVCKLSFIAEHNDYWFNPLGSKPQVANGRILMSIEFETNAALDKNEYRSLRVVSMEEQTHERTWKYKCLCLRGKETQELISYLYGKED